MLCFWPKRLYRNNAMSRSSERNQVVVESLNNLFFAVASNSVPYPDHISSGSFKLPRPDIEAIRLTDTSNKPYQRTEIYRAKLGGLALDFIEGPHGFKEGGASLRYIIRCSVFHEMMPVGGPFAPPPSNHMDIYDNGEAWLHDASNERHHSWRPVGNAQAGIFLGNVLFLDSISVS